MKFTKDQMYQMYEGLVFSRVMAEKITEYILNGRIAGAIHPATGQEAVAAGMVFAYRNSPYNVYRSCTHRNQVLMADAVGLDNFLAELMNRATGIVGGIAGEYHLVSLKDYQLPCSGILGQATASATGYAWGLKLRGETQSVVGAVFGDGQMSEGYVYESMNMASIHKLPILYIVENNGWAMATPSEEEAPVADLYLRGIAAGMKAAAVDGNDVEAVVESIMTGLEQAAKFAPNLLEMKTLRWGGHFLGDKQEVYRDMSFKDNLEALDPLLRYEKVLMERGVANEDHFKKVRAEQEALLSEAFEKAVSAPLPQKSAFLNPDIVYTNTDGISFA